MKIKELNEWMAAERGRQAWLAEAIGMNESFLSQIKSGRRKVPPVFCPAIEAATKGEVTRRHLRPNDWRKLWPEMVKKYRPPSQTAGIASQ